MCPHADGGPISAVNYKMGLIARYRDSSSTMIRNVAMSSMEQSLFLLQGGSAEVCNDDHALYAPESSKSLAT